MAKETSREKQLRNMIARRLKEVREAKGVSQETLAKSLDVTQGLVSQYESGLIPMTLDTILDVCDILGCSIDYLLGREVQYTETPIGRMIKAFSELKSEDQQLMVAMTEAAGAVRGA